MRKTKYCIMGIKVKRSKKFDNWIIYWRELPHALHFYFKQFGKKAIYYNLDKKHTDVRKIYVDTLFEKCCHLLKFLIKDRKTID